VTIERSTTTDQFRPPSAEFATRMSGFVVLAGPTKRLPRVA